MPGPPTDTEDNNHRIQSHRQIMIVKLQVPSDVDLCDTIIATLL